MTDPFANPQAFLATEPIQPATMHAEFVLNARTLRLMYRRGLNVGRPDVLDIPFATFKALAATILQIEAQGEAQHAASHPALKEH